MAIHLYATINVNIQTVDVSGTADSDIQSYCTATPVESSYTFPIQYSQAAQYTWDAHTYAASTTDTTPAGAQCIIYDGSDSIQIISHPDCPYGNLFGTCFNYLLVPTDGADGYGPSFEGNYTHNVNVTYTPPVVEGCTDEYALNYLPEATSDDGSCEYDEVSFDINNDGQSNILDVVQTVEILVNEPNPSIDSYQMLDLNNDNTINILDVVMMVSFILARIGF